MGNDSINDTTIIKDFLLETSSNMDLSFQIVNTMKALKIDLRAKFYLQMIEIGNELDIFFDPKEERFYLENLGDNTVGFSFEDGGILYGIKRKSDNKDERKFPALESLFSEGLLWSYWWPVHFWLFENIETNSEFWYAINDGSGKKKIKDFIVKLMQSDFVAKDTMPM